MNPITIVATPNSKQRTGTPGAHPLPSTWEPKKRTVQRLAKELGVSESALLESTLAPFREIANERSFLYRDWERAFSNCVRKAWIGRDVAIQALAGVAP